MANIPLWVRRFLEGALLSLIMCAGGHALYAASGVLSAGASSIVLGSNPNDPSDSQNKLFDANFTNHARALVISDGNKRIAIVSLDALLMSGENWTRNITSEIGILVNQTIPLDGLIITCTHSHHSTPLQDGQSDSLITTYKTNIVQAIINANSYAQPAELAVASDSATEGFNRLVRALPIPFIWSLNPIEMNPNNPTQSPWDYYLSQRPEDPVDRNVGIIYIRAINNGTPIATLVNYAAHATVIDAGTIHDESNPDYPGYLEVLIKNKLENKFGGHGGEVLFLQGAAGDIDPFDSSIVIDSDEKVVLVKARLNAIANDIGTVVLNRISAMTNFQSVVPLSFKQSTVGSIYGCDWPNMALEDKPTALLLKVTKATVSTLMIGKNISLGAFPGEFFTALGLQFKQQSPAPFSLFLGYSNDFIGYVPPTQDWGSGKYGTVRYLSDQFHGAYCVVNNGAGERIVAAAVNNIYQQRADLTFQLQPISISVNEGQAATFSAVASGNPAYQWQQLINGTWISIFGATSANYTTPAVRSGDNGAQFRVVATDANGAIPSRAATLTVNYITISIQPTPQSGVVGDAVTFSVTAVGNPSALRYQWLKKASGGTVYTAIPGATGSSYSISVICQTDRAIYAVAVSNGMVSVTSNDASLTITFSSAITGPSFCISSTLPMVDLARFKIGDFNGDGRTDYLVVTGWGGSSPSVVFLSNGDGSYRTVQGPTFSVSSSLPLVDLARIKLGDFTGNGRTDVMVVNGWGTTLPSSIYLANADGTFQPAIAGPSFSVSSSLPMVDLARIKLGDFTGNGRTDVMVVYGWGTTSPSTIYLANANGTFQPAIAGPSFSVSSSLPLVDLARIKLGKFNGYGRTDVMVVNGWGTSLPSSIYLANANGTFKPPIAGPSFSVANFETGANVDLARIKIGDFNGDNMSDIIQILGWGSALPSLPSAVYLSQGNGTFSSAINGPSFSVSNTCDGAMVDLGRIRVGDFNGDHADDLLQIMGWGYTSPMNIYLSNRDGSFWPTALFGPDFSVSASTSYAQVDLSRVFLGNFSGSGKTDILLVNGWGTSEPAQTYISILQ